MVKIHTETHCKKELNGALLRATPARLAVLRLLETTNSPIDVSMIKNYLDKKNVLTDPATIFRIINMFTQKGITIPIQFQEGKTRYELANKKHHHHLICESCGRIQDVSTSIIPTVEKEIQKKQNFLIKRHSLEFFGLCANCQK